MAEQKVTTQAERIAQLEDALKELRAKKITFNTGSGGRRGTDTDGGYDGTAASAVDEATGSSIKKAARKSGAEVRHQASARVSKLLSKRRKDKDKDKDKDKESS